MDFIIRKLISGDTHLLHQLILDWYGDDDATSSLIPDEEYLKQLLGRPDYYVYVALFNEKVIGGFTAYELQMFNKKRKEVFLYEIGVNEMYRRMNVARELIERLKSDCKANDIESIFVGTSADNEGAIRLYESSGGRRENIPWFTFE